VWSCSLSDIGRCIEFQGNFFCNGLKGSVLLWDELRTRIRCTHYKYIWGQSRNIFGDVFYWYMLVALMFMEPCIARCVFYITNEMQLTQCSLVLSALYVSGDFSAHHRELIKLYVQPCVLSCFPAVYPSTPAVDSRKAWQFTRLHIQFYKLLMMGGKIAWNVECW